MLLSSFVRNYPFAQFVMKAGEAKEKIIPGSVSLNHNFIYFFVCLQKYLIHLSSQRSGLNVDTILQMQGKQFPAPLL